MLITNGDRLKHHFQTTIAVKLFTVPEILTIINTFSVDIPKETEMVIPVNDNDIVHMTLESFMDFKTSKISEAADGPIPAICKDCKSKAYEYGFDAGYEAGKKDFDINTQIAAAEAEDDFITIPRHMGMTEAYKLQNELKKIIESEAESEGHEDD